MPTNQDSGTFKGGFGTFSNKQPLLGGILRVVVVVVYVGWVGGGGVGDTTCTV